MSSNRATLKPADSQILAEACSMLRQPGKCAEANHLHAIVMGMARCPYRSAETSDDADGNAIGAQYRCCDSRRSQTIAPQPTTAIFAVLLSVQAARRVTSPVHVGEIKTSPESVLPVLQTSPSSRI